LPCRARFELGAFSVVEGSRGRFCEHLGSCVLSEAFFQRFSISGREGMTKFWSKEAAAKRSKNLSQRGLCELFVGMSYKFFGGPHNLVGFSFKEGYATVLIVPGLLYCEDRLCYNFKLELNNGSGTFKSRSGSESWRSAIQKYSEVDVYL
jgi:hypothetical protein